VGESDRELVRIPLVTEGLARMPLPRGVMMISGAYDKVGDLLRHSFLRPNVRVIDVLRTDTGRLEIEGDIPASLELVSNRVFARTPEQIEEALGLSRSARRQIQQDLTDLGFNTRGIDGLFGNGTRTAIQGWQQRERLARTGYLNAAQGARLRQQGNVARVQLRANDRRYWSQTGAGGTERGLQLYLQRYPNGQFANQARAELARMAARTDEQSWARAVRTNTDASYREYLREFPNGVYKDIARTRIGAAPAVVNNAAKRVEDGLRLNSVSRLLIEQRVADLGYNPGRRDGNFDLASRQAFRAYQRDRNLPETGYITANMIRRLLLGQ
jgi:peptidoglycan hydrolase-like protein with peptidoglycan-binding domain